MQNMGQVIAINKLSSHSSDINTIDLIEDVLIIAIKSKPENLPN